MELCHNLLPNPGPGPGARGPLATVATPQPVGLPGLSPQAEPSTPCFSLSLLAAWQDVVKAKPAEMESTEMLSDKGWGYPGETF